jgi:NAD(P)-dependent dehydrogenase (short-subunit alcohol dehydrogenase family)
MSGGGRLQDKVLLLTGAGGGLGRATALACATEGARLALTDRDEAALQATLAQVQARGAEAIAQTGDVGEAATHAALVARALSRWGALHGLANIAGVLGPGALADATPTLFDQVMRVNCLAQLLAIQAAAPALRANRGAIVNVASIGALVGLPMMAVYCASKSAVLGLTRAVALELAPEVRCNAVCPGGIDTPMARGLLDSVPAEHRDGLLAQLTGRQLIQRFARPEEIAATLVFLLSDEATFMTGAVMAADGGHSAA